MQSSAAAKPRSDQGHEFVLDYAALVMAFLRPGIRKQQLHLIETAGGNLLAQHLDCIVGDDAQIGHAGLGCREQQVADPGTVYLDAEEVAVGLRQRALEQMLAVTESDLQRACCDAAEQPRLVQYLRHKFDAKTRPMLIQGALLCRSDSAGSKHVGADGAMVRLVGGLLHRSIIASKSHATAGNRRRERPSSAA